MSNADYVTRATGQPFCPKASLTAAVAQLDTVLPIGNVQSVGPGDRWVGMAALLGGEVVEVTQINSGNVHVKRGCADTVPASHATGTALWFFDGHVGTDNREYAGGTVALKVLPKTSSTPTPIAYSPPQNLTFAYRFIRPYPPADVKINGTSVFTATLRLTSSQQFDLTVATRNRVVQSDVLLGHTESSMAPETGQVTRVRLYSASTDALATTYTFSGSAWSYDRDTAGFDFGLSVGSGDFSAYAVIDSLRDGYASWQSYRFDFIIDTSGMTALTARLTEGGATRTTESGVTRTQEN